MAAHRHRDVVFPFRDVLERFRLMTRQVVANLAHHLDRARVDLSGRTRASAVRLDVLSVVRYLPVEPLARYVLGAAAIKETS